MPQVNFDAMDEAVIAGVLNSSGENLTRYVRNDEVPSVFLARELVKIRQKVYETEYPEPVSARILFPVTNELAPHENVFEYRIFDQVGIAKIIADYTDDLPMVNAFSRVETGRAFPVGNAYGYSLDEMLTAIALGRPLSTRYSMTARRAHEAKLNELAFYGDTSYHIVGVFDHPNIPTITSAGWTTIDNAWDELDQAIRLIMTNTKSFHRANTVAVPPSRWQAMSRPLAGTATSQLEYWRKQYPTLSILPILEMEDIDGAGTKGVLVYERGEDNASLEIPRPFEQLPAQADNLSFKVPCWSKLTGVTVYRPLTHVLIRGV